MTAPITVTVKTIQSRRSFTAGYRPPALAEGEPFIQYADQCVILGGLNGQGSVELPFPGSPSDPARVVRFSTYALAQAAPLAGATRIELSGYYAPGDTATPLTYTPLGAAPSPIRAWHLKTADGGWWTLNTSEVSPEAFGANGVAAADTAALQACQDYPAAALIRSPAKTYNLSSAGLILAAGKSWEGRSTGVRMSVAPTGDMVRALNISGFKIRGVTFDGNGFLTGTTSSYSPSFLPCLYVGGCSDFEVSGCKALGFKTCGLLFNAVTAGTIARNVVTQANPTGTFANYGIAVLGGTAAPSTNIHVDANTCIGCDIAVCMGASWVTDNEVSGWGFSAGINVAAEASCSGLTIIGNKCHDCLRRPDRDGYFMDGIECWALDTVCHANICYRNIGSGIGWGSRRGSCLGNTCYDNGLTAAEFAALGYSGSPVAQGILAIYQDGTFSAEDSLVSGNTLYDTRPAGSKTQTYGYREVTSYSFTNITVALNKTFGNATGDYSLNGTKSVDFTPYPGDLTAFTASATSAGGALGAGSSVSAFYQMIGRKLCFVEYDIRVPDNGNGSDSVLVPLPFPAVAGRQQVVSGAETAVNGQLLGGVIGAGASSVRIKGQSNSYPGGSGMRLVVSGTYAIS